MKISVSRWIASLVLGLATAVPSCGGTLSNGDSGGGTDSNTHWLHGCSQDSDCGTLDCVCGICTQRCAGNHGCEALGEMAVCADPVTCGAAETATACVAGCTKDADCPRDSLECRGGQCIERSGSGPDAGAPNCAGVDCTTDDCPEGFEEHFPPGACCKICRRTECSPMDAASTGARCEGVRGYTWDGNGCVPISCECEGSDCEQLFETAADCRISYADCLAPDDPCRPMDAFTNGDDCASIAGYAYDGRSCHGIECGCTGEDCGKITETLAECAQAHAACDPLVTTTCQTDGDCAVTHAGCCGPCGVTSIDGVVALSQTTVAAYHESQCQSVGSCPDCVTSQNPTIYPACLASQCVAVDAGPFAECSTDADCQIRARECCECNADVTSLVAVSDPQGYAQAICEAEGVTGCDGCLPVYPPDVQARCEVGRCYVEMADSP